VAATAATTGVLAAYGALQGIPIGRGRMRDYAAAEALRAATALAAVAIGLAAGLRTPAPLLAAWAVGAALGASVLTRGRMGPPGPHASRGIAREAIRRALKAHPTNLVGLAVARLDVVVLAAVSTRPQVAYYSLAVVIAEAAWLVPGALAVSAQSDYVRGDAAAAAEAARAAARRSVAAAAATGVVAGVGGTAVVWLLLPHAYHASLAPLWIVLAGTIPYSVGHVASPYLVTAVDRPRVATAIATTTLVVDLALLAAIGGPLGALGAAVASTAAYACNAALNVRALGAARPAAR
jgi:O-antigen/teichoic acid export membrane protein